MEKTGLVNSIIEGVRYITKGRRGLQIDGEEHEGRLSFERGHALVREVFAAALEAQDVEMLILAEYIYTAQELAESSGKEPYSRSSAKAGLAKFDDALLALKAVEEGAPYHTVDMAFPHETNYRYKGMPRDSFHLACFSDKTRIRNGLSRFGIPHLDIDLAQRRTVALTAAQDIYFDKQTTAVYTEKTRTQALKGNGE
jgi:hypothetical protein